MLALALLSFSAHAGQTSYFIYDESGHVIGEYDSSGNPIQEHVYLGDRPVAVVQGGSSAGGTVDYVTTDQLNTPRAITDSSQTVVWSWNSDPFGNGQPAGSITYNLRFPGQYYDSETGHGYNLNRDYDFGTGRYIESDPIGLSGGENTYVYVSSTPLSRRDKFGLAGGEEDDEVVREEPLEQILENADAKNLINELKQIDPDFSIARDSNAKITERDIQFLKDYLKALRDQVLCQVNKSPYVDPKSILGLSPAQTDALAEALGLIPKGLDPVNGQGSYVDPVTGQQRVLIHPNGSDPHAHVNNPAGERLDANGNVVDPNSPDAHLSIQPPPPG
jgi:RHS repeat-associated protein